MVRVLGLKPWGGHLMHFMAGSASMTPGRWTGPGIHQSVHSSPIHRPLVCLVNPSPPSPSCRYHQYLVALAATAARDQGDPGFLEEVLRGEVAAIRGLLEESSDYRWAVLTLAALFRRLAALLGGGAAGEEAAGMVAESEGLYERLVELDPDHASRYRNILADGRARARAV